MFFSLAIYEIGRLKKPQCLYVSVSQKIIRFKLMNSNVNSLMFSSRMLLTKFENVPSHDLEDWETQEAQMWVHPSVHSSQKIIRFKSMNSSVNSFLE